MEIVSERIVREISIMKDKFENIVLFTELEHDLEASRSISFSKRIGRVENALAGAKMLLVKTNERLSGYAETQKRHADSINEIKEMIKTLSETMVKALADRPVLDNMH